MEMETGAPHGTRAAFWNIRFHALLIVIFGFAAYSNTFAVPFQFDDNLFLSNVSSENPEAWDVLDLLSMFSETVRHFGSRPLLNATLLLNYYIGGLDTWGYHAVNLALHLVNGVLLYFLVVMTGRSLGSSEEDVRSVALLASLLFVLHPVQTEAVTNIIGRSMLLSTSFCFSGLILFNRAVAATRRRAFYVAGLLLASLAGASSRENFFAFPLMLLLYDLFFISRFRPEALARHLREYLAVVPGVVYLVFLTLNSTYDRLEYPGLSSLSAQEYLLTSLNVLWTYLRLLVLPVGQNLDYDYPIAGTLFEMPTLISFVGCLGLLAGGIALARRRPVISFGVLWFLLALSPVSFGTVLARLLLNMRIGDVIFEHRLYLPSAGPIVVAAVALVLLARQRNIVITAAVAIVLALGGAAYARNALWKDGVTLWSDVIAKSPNKARGHNNLATFYEIRGSMDKAIEHLTEALRLKPTGKYHYNLGLVYANRDSAKAIEHLEASLRTGDPSIGNPPVLFRAHTSLGTLYRDRGMYEKAMSHYHKALILQTTPQEKANALYYLGTVYERTGKTEKALNFYLAALNVRPGDSILHSIVANAYDTLGRHKKANEHRRKAKALSRLNPDNPRTDSPRAGE